MTTYALAESVELFLAAVDYMRRNGKPIPTLLAIAEYHAKHAA